jgi:hypothetical protein
MARRAKEPGRLRRLGDVLSTRGGRLLVKCALASLLFLASGWVVRQGRAYAWRLPDFRVRASGLSLAGLPDWLHPEVKERIFAPALFAPLDVSVYDGAAEGAIRTRVEAHPMVRRVERVAIRYPNSAVVDTTLRAPVARVWVPDESAAAGKVERFLSDDGCLLPLGPYASYQATLTFPLPLVTGIRAAPPRRLGETWEDGSESVLEAVAAARLAERLFADFQGRVWVTSIDVSRFPARGHDREGGEVVFTVSCPSGRPEQPRTSRRVQWGRTERARAQVPGEDGYDVKVDRLRTLLTRVRPPSDLDVRYEAH